MSHSPKPGWTTRSQTSDAHWHATAAEASKCHASWEHMLVLGSPLGPLFKSCTRPTFVPLGSNTGLTVPLIVDFLHKGPWVWFGVCDLGK